MITLKDFRRLTQQHRVATPAMFVGAFAVVGTLLLLATHAATPLQASVGWSGTNTGGQLLNINSGLCLSTPGTAQGGIGTIMQLSTCDSSHANKNQQWSITWGSGTVVNTIVKNGYGQCLDDRQGGATAGSTVQIWSCDGITTSQTWSTGYGDGTIRIHGLCLGVSGNLKNANAAVVLLNCNLPPPTPSINITAPASGATVGGSSVAVAATATVPYGSVTSITLTINSAVIKTCANTTSCSATWNTTGVQNGSYTIGVTAAATDGGGAQASRSVTVNNVAPSPSPAPSPTPPKSGGSGSGGSSGSGSPQPAGGVSSSGSDANTDLVQNTAPSDGVQSGSGDTSGDVNSSSSNDNTNSSGHSSSNNSGSASTASHGKSYTGKIALAATTLTLLTAGLIWFVVVARRRKENALPPLPVFDPNAPTYPQEDSATTAARLNWWLPEDQRQAIAHHQPNPASKPPEDTPLDMFEEGRKRLEEEEKQHRLEH